MSWRPPPADGRARAPRATRDARARAPGEVPIGAYGGVGDRRAAMREADRDAAPGEAAIGAAEQLHAAAALLHIGQHEPPRRTAEYELGSGDLAGVDGRRLAVPAPG